MCRTTRTHRHGTARASHVAAIVLAALPILGAGNLCSAQTVWTAGTSDWFTPANWTLGVPNAAGGTTFDAIIANGGTAQLSVPGGSVRRLRVGVLGGRGSLLVDGGKLVVTENLHLNEGSNGLAAVIVQGASTVTSPSTIVGHSSAFNTSFLISDPGTVYNATTAFIVGQAGASVASLTVGSGAVLASGTSTLGSLAGSTGTATVTGTGSRWSTSGAFTVGSAGVGTLNILNQGVVSVGTALSIGGTSNVNLDGGTLRFNSATGLNRINYTSGTIQLAGQFRVFNSDAAIIALFGSRPTIPSGKVLITEGTSIIENGGTTVNGGSLSSLNVLVVGGQLTITGGGTVSNVGTGLAGGQSRSSIGSVVVSGAGSTWNNLESLRVGVPGSLNPGRSFVTVDDGGTVSVAQTLSIVDRSNVTLQGGTIRFDGYAREATSHFNFIRGTVQLVGNRTLGTDLAIADLFGASPVISTGKRLAIEGTADVQAPVILGGGTLKANSFAVSERGALVFDRGFLEITGGGTIAGLPSLVVPANGEFRVSGIQTMQVTGAAGSSITASADLTLGNAALANGFYTNGALDAGTHAVTLSDANEAVLDSAALVTIGAGGSPGTLAAANGLTLNFGGSLTGFGTVNTPNNVATPLINNGHITGNSVAEPLTLTGFVKGVGTLDNVNITGTLAPGLSPTILIVGNVAFSPTSTLVMELGGATPGSGYDQIQSSGVLAFDGMLHVTLINGFTPSAGQSFHLLDGRSAGGTFDGLALPALADDLEWNTSQLYTTGMLKVGYADDFDLDGDVDGAGASWKSTSGSVDAVASTAAVAEGECPAGGERP